MSQTALQRPNRSCDPALWMSDAHLHDPFHAPALVMVVMQVEYTQCKVLLLKVVVQQLIPGLHLPTTWGKRHITICAPGKGGVEVQTYRHMTHHGQQEGLDNGSSNTSPAVSCLRRSARIRLCSTLLFVQLVASGAQISCKQAHVGSA
jgi:hypothetical protein